MTSSEGSSGNGFSVQPNGTFGDPSSTPSSDLNFWSNLTWKQIMAAVNGGAGYDPNDQTAVEQVAAISDPTTLFSAANSFYFAQRLMTMVAQSITDQANALAGPHGPWQGDAATEFLSQMLGFASVINAYATQIGRPGTGDDDVPTQLYNDGAYLEWARNELDALDTYWAEQAQAAGAAVSSDGLVVSVSQVPWVLQGLHDTMYQVATKLDGVYSISVDKFNMPNLSGFTNPTTPPPDPTTTTPPPDPSTTPPPTADVATPSPNLNGLNNPANLNSLGNPTGPSNIGNPSGLKNPANLADLNNPGDLAGLKNLANLSDLNNLGDLAGLKNITTPKINTPNLPNITYPKIPSEPNLTYPKIPQEPNITFPNEPANLSEQQEPNLAALSQLGKTPAAEDIAGLKNAAEPGGLSDLSTAGAKGGLPGDLPSTKGLGAPTPDSILSPKTLDGVNGPGAAQQQTEGGGMPMMPGMGGAGAGAKGATDRPDAAGLLGGHQQPWAGVNPPAGMGDPATAGGTSATEPVPWALPLTGFAAPPVSQQSPAGEMPMMPGMGGAGAGGKGTTDRPDAAGLLGGKPDSWEGVNAPASVGDPVAQEGAAPMSPEVWAVTPAGVPFGVADSEPAPDRRQVHAVPVVTPSDDREDPAAWDVGAPALFAGIAAVSLVPTDGEPAEQLPARYVESDDETWEPAVTAGVYQRRKTMPGDPVGGEVRLRSSGEDVMSPPPVTEQEPDEDVDIDDDIDDEEDSRRVADLLNIDSSAWGRSAGTRSGVLG